MSAKETALVHPIVEPNRSTIIIAKVPMTNSARPGTSKRWLPVTGALDSGVPRIRSSAITEMTMSVRKMPRQPM